MGNKNSHIYEKDDKKRIQNSLVFILILYHYSLSSCMVGIILDRQLSASEIANFARGDTTGTSN